MNKHVARTCDKSPSECMEKRMKTLIENGQLYRGINPALILKFDKMIKGLKINQINNKN